MLYDTPFPTPNAQTIESAGCCGLHSELGYCC